MDYENLRKYQRMERNNSKLTEVDDNFYSDLSLFIDELKRKYEMTNSQQDLKALENTLKVARDIFERREQKILMKALRCIKSDGIEEDNIVQMETQLFKNLKRSLQSNRSIFEGVLLGNSVLKTSRPETEPEKILEEKLEAIDNSVQTSTSVTSTSAEKTSPEPVDTLEADGKSKEGEDLNNVLVRILKKVPKFVSSDLKEYGPFDTNEIKKLPHHEAELLSKKEFVEII